MRLIFTILPLFMTLLCSCQKEHEMRLPEDEIDTYGYEVECESCTISFVDEKQRTQSVFNQSGKMSVDFKLAIYHDLEVGVSLRSNNVKLAKAAILKNGQPIKSYQSYTSFTLTPSGGTPTRSPGSKPSTPSTPSTPSQPTSSICGAPTKAGGYCKRKVANGGRCWQHK